jgi:hypothetical protein
VPRVGGEPGGTSMPLEAGGEPCKHLVWVDEDKKKEASEDLEKTAYCDYQGLVEAASGN